jgi:prepilin-type N-terminal cleavage/methylation domain-containing protein
MLDALNPRRETPKSHGKSMRVRGLTLMELMVTVAILGILVALAVPSFNSFLAKGRLSGAAEALAQDLQLARSEALRRNAEVTISFSSGTAWCYGAIVSATACDCTQTNSCSLRRVDNTDYAGLTMSDLSFPSNTPATFTSFTAHQGLANTGAVQFTHPNAGTLRVRLGAAGQVSICSTSGGLAHHPAC